MLALNPAFGTALATEGLGEEDDAPRNEMGQEDYSLSGSPLHSFTRGEPHLLDSLRLWLICNILVDSLLQSFMCGYPHHLDSRFRRQKRIHHLLSGSLLQSFTQGESLAETVAHLQHARQFAGGIEHFPCLCFSTDRCCTRSTIRWCTREGKLPSSTLVTAPHFPTFEALGQRCFARRSVTFVHVQYVPN